MRALFLSALFLATATAFVSDELSTRVFGACDGPPVDVLTIFPRHASAWPLLSKVTSLTHSLLLRGGCAAQSRYAHVPVPVGGLSSEFGKSSVSGMYSRIRNLPVAGVSNSDMATAIREASTFLATVPATSRAVVVIALPWASLVDSDLVAAIASLQHSGVRVVAVVPRVAHDLSASDDASAARVAEADAIAHAAAGIVSDPVARNLFFVHEGADKQGAFMDLSLPHQQLPYTTAASNSHLLLPFDPRSADPCVTPHVCMIGASGVVRSFMSQTIRVSQQGEFVLASYRTPTHGVVDIFGGAGRCPAGVSGVCLTKVSVVPRDMDSDFTTIRAVPGGLGATVSEGYSGYSSFFNEDNPTNIDDSAASARMIQLSAVHVSPTWQSTNQPRPSGNGSHPIASYHIVIRDVAGMGTGSLYVDADNGVLAVTIVVGAEATPTRSGLCGVPAGPIGEDASPASRLPRHVRYTGVTEDVYGANPFNVTSVTDAQAGASHRRPCPPTSETYRLFDMSEDGIERVHVHSRLTDNDFATVERLERNAAGASGKDGNRDSVAARLPSRYYGSYQRLSVSSSPRDENCVRAFGEDSFLNTVCESHAETGASFGVYSTVRTASNLCRMRCLHPDTDRPVTYKLTRAGATQAAMRMSTSGTEILDDLVAPSWCEANICELLKPMLPKTLPEYSMTENTYAGSRVEPGWFLLSAQKTRDEHGYISKVGMIAQGMSHAAIVTPPQGGTYTLRAKIDTQACKGAVPNVTLNARCPRVLDAPYAGENVTVERKGDSFPFVALHGQVRTLEDLAVPPRYEVWWSVAEYPKSPVAEYYALEKSQLENGRVIVYPRTTAPLFAPPHAGLWKLSFSVFDGCAVRTSYVNVLAKCGASCSPNVRATSVTTGMIEEDTTRVAMSVTYSRSASANGMDGIRSGVYTTNRYFNVTIDEKAFEAVPSAGAASNVVAERTVSTTVNIPAAYGEVLRVTPGTWKAKWDAFYDLPNAASANVLSGLPYHRLSRTMDHVNSKQTVSHIGDSYPLPTPTQCSLPHDRSNTISTPLNSATQSRNINFERSWPQVSTYQYDSRYYHEGRQRIEVTTDLPAYKGPVCETGKNPHRIESAAVTGNLPMYADNTELVFSTLRFDDDPACPTSETVHGKVWIHTSRQKIPRKVSLSYWAVGAAAYASHNSTDGLYPGAVWLEYRAITDAVAASATWNDTRVVDDAGEWKSVAASYRYATTGAMRTLEALVPGQTAVRAVVEIRPHRIYSIYLNSFSVMEMVHADPAVCNGQHVTGKVQATDGCAVAEDTFETSFECPPPPQVELTTPHLDVDFDYSTSSWPSVSVSSFQTLTDGLALAHTSVDQTYTTNTKTFATFAYEAVAGYADAQLLGAYQHTVSYDWSDNSATRAPCSASTNAFSINGWQSTKAGVVYTPYTTWNSLRRGLLKAGPQREHPWDSPSLVVTTRCKDHTDDVLYYHTLIDDLPSNVTHVNVSFYVHATHGGGDNKWSVDYASYTLTSSAVDGLLEEAIYGHGQEFTAPLQANVYDGWKFVSHIVPVSTYVAVNQQRHFALRLSWKSTDPRTSGALAGDKYIAISKMHVRAAYVARSKLSDHVEDFAVKGEGVARFGVHIENSCHKRSVFVDVKANCKHDIPDQHIAVYTVPPTDGVLIANSSAATTGTKKIRGVPTALASAAVGLIDGVKLVEGTGVAYATFTLGDAEIAYAGQSATAGGVGQYQAFQAWGDSNGKYPWNSTTFVESELVGGIVGWAQFPVTRAGAGKVVVRTSDGCRWRQDAIDVEYLCSDTVWTGTTAHYSNTANTDSITETPSGADFRVVFTVAAEYAAEQSDGTLSSTRTSVASAAWRRVEVLSRTPVAGASVDISTNAGDTWKQDGNIVYAWNFENSDGNPTFRAVGEGVVRVRVTYGFVNDCSAPANAIEFDIKIVKQPCLQYTASSEKKTSQKFQMLMEIVLKDYAIADFTTAASPKRKEAMVAALNADNSPLKNVAVVADATAVAEGADARVTLTLRFDDSDTDFSRVEEKLEQSKSFQRTFGYIDPSKSRVYVRTIAPTDVTITWTGDTVPTLDRFDFVVAGDRYPVCGGSAAACPAFASKALTLAVDAVTLASYKSINPTARRLWVGTGDPIFSVNGCKPDNVDLFGACANIGPGSINPVAAVGVVDGAQIAASDVKPDAPGTIEYAKDEARGFQRVYLVDNTPTPTWLYEGQNNLFPSSNIGYPGAYFESEWVVIEAPATSLYAPRWGNSTVELDKRRSTNLFTPIFYTTQYAATSASPWSAFVEDKGTHYVNHHALQTVSDQAASTFSGSFVRIGKETGAECLRSTQILGNPRSEACWTPDVAGRYVIGYRANVNGCQSWSGSQFWLNNTLTFNAVCPAFEAKFSGELPSTVKFGQHLGVNAPATATSLQTARLNLAVDTTGTARPDHVIYSWSAERVADVPGSHMSSSCQGMNVKWAKWHDGHDANTTAIFECPGRYNVTVFVTDGCQKKALTQMVDITCGASELLQTQLPNITYSINVPEGGDLGSYGTVEVPYGSAAAMAALESEGMPCLSSLSVEWDVVDYVPHSDVEATGVGSYEPERVSGDNVFITGAAGEARAAGLTTGGDVLTTIMVFAIIVAVVTTFGVAVYLVISGREAMQLADSRKSALKSSGVVHPTEPAAVGPSVSYDSPTANPNAASPNAGYGR